MSLSQQKEQLSEDFLDNSGISMVANQLPTDKALIYDESLEFKN